MKVFNVTDFHNALGIYYVTVFAPLSLGDKYVKLNFRVRMTNTFSVL